MRTPWLCWLLLAALLAGGVGCGKKGPPIRARPPPAPATGVAEPPAAPAPAPAEPEFQEGGVAP